MLSKLRKQGDFHNLILIKDIYRKPTINIGLNGKSWMSSPKTKNRQEYMLSPHHTESHSHSNKGQGEEKRKEDPNGVISYKNNY